MRHSERYPYTYAADYLRMKVGDDYGKGLISRAAASQVQKLIADAIGMSSEEIAIKLAEKYIYHEENATAIEPKENNDVCEWGPPQMLNGSLVQSLGCRHGESIIAASQVSCPMCGRQVRHQPV